MLIASRQRLLFRVLHAMALYLPDTGYVQGMAALAATLLCYYEEDKAFVMLVRLWMHRGLEKLYESGFSGLMDALDDFQKNWMRGGDVAKKLVGRISVPCVGLQAGRKRTLAHTWSPERALGHALLSSANQKPYRKNCA